MSRWRRAFRQSVLAQALALNLITALAVGGLISGIFVLTTRRIVIQQARLRATEMASLVATRAQFPMLVGDRSELDRLARETMQLEDVLYIVLTDKDGASVRLGRGVPVDRSLSRTAEYVEVELAVPQPDSRDLLGMEAGNPAAAQLSIGAVRIGLSLKQAREASIAAVGRALGVGAFGLAIILRRQARQLKRRLAPLRSLADFTMGISEGKLDRRAEVTGVDEIANLASSFNQMLDRLAVTLVSKDLAEQANQAKGRFIAGASHELRTPLHAIIGYSELLEEECADRGLKDMIPDLIKIRNSGRVLLELVNDLLDYTKAEEGRLQLALEPVPVAPVIQEVADTVDLLARKNGNRLVVECPPDEVVVYADRTKFRQSLLNLVGNACKFTERGTITLSASALNAGPGGWAIQVADTGIGIAPDQMDKLFQAFVQIDASNTRKYGGTGLGLALSRKFCRMMGGDITVKSELGRGSTFTICLPPCPAAPQIPAQEMTALAETRDEGNA